MSNIFWIVKDTDGNYLLNTITDRGRNHATAKCLAADVYGGRGKREWQKLWYAGYRVVKIEFKECD